MTLKTFKTGIKLLFPLPGGFALAGLCGVLVAACLLFTSCKERSREDAPDSAKTTQTQGESDSTEALNAQAIKILGQYGCPGCHSENGSQLVGPTFKGLWNRQRELSDGRTVTVDEDYIRKSIMDPDADIVKGYPEGLMPKQVITGEEVKIITEYLKGL